MRRGNAVTGSNWDTFSRHFFSHLDKSRCLSTQEKVLGRVSKNHFCFHQPTTRYTFANFEPSLPAVQAAQGQLTHGAHGDCELEISHRRDHLPGERRERRKHTFRSSTIVPKSASSVAVSGSAIGSRRSARIRRAAGRGDTPGEDAAERRSERDKERKGPQSGAMDACPDDYPDPMVASTRSTIQNSQDAASASSDAMNIHS